MPPRLDDKSVIAALREVRHEWEIRDTWRWANPTKKAFTYRAQTHSICIQARLDWIYISKKAEPFTFDWEIKELAIPTDHAMVSVRYAPKEAPRIRKGWWTLPLYLLNNKTLVEKITKHGIVLQSNIMRDQIEHTNRQIANTQTHWEAYKNSIHKLAKEAAKECYHKITSCIKAIVLWTATMRPLSESCKPLQYKQDWGCLITTYCTIPPSVWCHHLLMTDCTCDVSSSI